MKCDAPADGYRLRKKFYWHPSGYYLLIFFPGILIYAIVALIIRKKTSIAIGLCPIHWRKRRRAILIGLLAFLLGLAGLISGVAISTTSRENNGVFVVLAGVGLILFSALWAIYGVRVLWPRKVDDRNAWYAGASAEFLRSIPTAR